MTDWIQGMDISKWQGDIPQEKWDGLKDLGIEVAVVGSWHGYNANPYASRNLSRADAAGMAIATYVALNAGSGITAVRSGKHACGAMWDKLRFVALDCEIKGITPQRIAEAEADVKALGLRPVIYTRRNWWREEFGDSRQFSHLPLWNAWYDHDDDVDFPHAQYGGWTPAQLMGEQYTDTTAMGGVDLDRNIFNKDFVYQGEDAMAGEAVSREEFDKLRAELKASQDYQNKIIAEVVRRLNNAGSVLNGGTK